MPWVDLRSGPFSAAYGYRITPAELAELVVLADLGCCGLGIFSTWIQNIKNLLLFVIF